jgi:hypothetical protein
MLGRCLLWLWLLVVVPPWLADVAARGLVTSWLPYHRLSLISAGIFSGSVLLFAGSARSSTLSVGQVGLPPPSSPRASLLLCMCLFAATPASVRVRSCAHIYSCCSLLRLCFGRCVVLCIFAL